MRTEEKQIEGDLTLTDSLALYGQATGNIIVAEGGELLLYGMCARNLTVQEGGDVPPLSVAVRSRVLG